MPDIQTVQGPVDAEELGVVLVHEHVRFRDEAVAAQWPDRYDEEAELGAALEAVEAAKSRGVQSIVDPTAMFGGRDVGFMKRVADQTGVRIIACTGIYSYDHLPHYFENRDVDAMADHFVADLQRGVQGSEIRAAFLKCAADASGVTERVEKIHRAIARASVQTGGLLPTRCQRSKRGRARLRYSSRRASTSGAYRSPTAATPTTSATSSG